MEAFQHIMSSFRSWDGCADNFFLITDNEVKEEIEKYKLIELPDNLIKEAKEIEDRIAKRDNL